MSRFGWLWIIGSSCLVLGCSDADKQSIPAAPPSGSFSRAADAKVEPANPSSSRSRVAEPTAVPTSSADRLGTKVSLTATPTASPASTPVPPAATPSTTTPAASPAAKAPPEKPAGKPAVLTTQQLADLCAERTVLEFLLRAEAGTSTSTGLQPTAFLALSRIPGLTFEQRAALGLRLIPHRGDPSVEPLVREVRFISIEVLAEDVYGLSSAQSTIRLRESQLAVLRKFGFQEAIDPEIGLCRAITAIEGPFPTTLRSSKELDGLNAARAKQAAVFLKALEADPKVFDTIAEGEQLLEQATTDELRTARQSVQKRLAP